MTPRAKNLTAAGRGQYTAPILVGLTPEQRDLVRAAAERDHRPVVAWARLALLDAAKRALKE